MSLPQEIGHALKEHFLFPERLLYGAVATVCNNRPNIRTMRIYDINHEGHLLLLTHVASHKWQEFVASPYAAINLVSENRLVQIIVRGELQLATPLSAYEKANHYWNKVRPDVRKIYNPTYTPGAPFQQAPDLQMPESVPDTFGMVSIIPDFWELLHLESDYINSPRYQFHHLNGTWQKQRIHVG